MVKMKNNKKKPTEKMAEYQKEILSLLNNEEIKRKTREAIFGKSGFTFDSSSKGDGFIDKVFKDGRRTTGRLDLEGNFIEMEC